MKLFGFIFIVLGMGINVYAFQNLSDNPHGKIGIKCSICHSTDNWEINRQKQKFDHNVTGYPLSGSHNRVACSDCHVDLVFSNISTACADCHLDIHRGELGKNCDNCHNPVSWENRLDLSKQHLHTRFPLIGAHAVIDCDACHINQQNEEYALTPAECRFCHQKDFAEAANPDHLKAHFAMDCLECHTLISMTWQPVQYQHTTTFPLTGGHSRADCQSCHGAFYEGTSNDCFSCHDDDYSNTTDPNHRIFGILTNCTICHTTQTWQQAAFDHMAASGYALDGAHRQVQCNQCHFNNVTTGLPRDCFGCHDSDFRTVSDPNHVAGNYPHDCTTCHSNIAWSPAKFNHNATAFPLSGAHQVVSCAECHVNNAYTGTPTDCFSCHQQDFADVTDPNHVAGGFDQNCTICHTTTAWSPANFDHNKTAFPLTGAHQTTPCSDCHANGVYAGTPLDCYACHQSDFNGTTNPNHIESGFDQDCTVCHSTTGWSPATFDHNKTAFPLTGRHTTASCTDCHSSGYSGTPADCFFCHENEYNSTTDPNHTAALFPKQCQECHNTTNWGQSTWNHDSQFFAIYTGSHRNEWDTCADCHVNTNNYQAFECIFCHEHNKASTDNKHNEVRNYQYLSSACYECHPTGRGD